MKNATTRLTTMLSLGGLLIATQAGAMPVLQMEYNNNLGASETITISDGDALDTATDANAVIALNPLSALNLNVGIGSIIDDPGAQFSIIVSDFTPPADGTLTATFADTDFTGGRVITFVNDFVANAGFNAQAELIVTLDNCNLLIDMGCIGTQVYSGPANLLQTAVYDFTAIATYGLALVQTFEIESSRPFGFSGDYSLSVPEPTTLALLGLGALALGAGAGRRRRA